MNNSTVTQRQTKYSQAIVSLLGQLGHATNTLLLEELRKTYPYLSATTVHRATARMAARGIIATAPNARDGAIRYDGNILPHDHFMCSQCDKLRDTDIKKTVIKLLESGIEDCRISGRLTISGQCSKCKE